jgi:iron complex transport system ATP-binding protein
MSSERAAGLGTNEGLVLERVSVEIGHRRILDEVSVALAPGELVTLLGPNGAGKTTLLRAALGLVRPNAGRVLVSGNEIRGLSPRARARELAWLPQYQAITEAQAVLEVVAAGRYRFSEPRALAEARALEALTRLGVAELADRAITTLSGGERQRVALATLVTQEARFALLDEPANHLDPAQQLETYRFVGELWASGIGVLLVSHDVNLPSVLDPELRGRVLGLRAGRIAFSEAAASPDLPRRLSELYDVEFRVLSDGARRVLVPAPRAGERR